MKCSTSLRRMTDAALMESVDEANGAFDLRASTDGDTAAEWKRLHGIYREVCRRLASPATDIGRRAVLATMVRNLLYGRRTMDSRGPETWFYTLLDATMEVIDACRRNPDALPAATLLPHLVFARQNLPRLATLLDSEITRARAAIG